MAADVTPDQMRDWYSPFDVLGIPGEHVVPEASTFDETVDFVLQSSGLSGAEAEAPCPARCPRCQERAH